MSGSRPLSDANDRDPVRIKLGICTLQCLDVTNGRMRMTRGRIIEQVHGILAGEHVSFTVADDGRRFHVPVPQGSAAVDIDFEDWGRSQTLIRLRTHVLDKVEVRADNRLEVLEHLNALNQSTVFGRFYLDADRSTIMLEHELLGNELDAAELINALYTIGLVADQTDDDLQRSLGTGRRAVEIEADLGDGGGTPGWGWSGTRQISAADPD
jgi:hypothetical protein